MEFSILRFYDIAQLISNANAAFSVQVEIELRRG